MAPIIVGIGASAGGQDAFARFFQHVPATNGLAFVLIQHLDPVHQTFLPETIATSTTMPVCQAEEAMELQPDHVYTIPRGSDLVLRQGRLHLFDRPVSRSLHLPIDTFFRSLAGKGRRKPSPSSSRAPAAMARWGSVQSRRRAASSSCRSRPRRPSTGCRAAP